MTDEHTAASFSDAEWTAFWRSNERQIMNYESIFKRTIRSHPWQDHSTRVCPLMLERARPEWLSVRTLEGGVRTDSSDMLKGRDPTAAMCAAVWLMSLPWGEPLELPEPESGTHELG